MGKKKQGFEQTDGKKWSNIQFVYCSLGELKEEMTEEKAEIFFVAQGCSSCAKCHAVNVKGGEES